MCLSYRQSWTLCIDWHKPACHSFLDKQGIEPIITSDCKVYEPELCAGEAETSKTINIPRVRTHPLLGSYRLELLIFGKNQPEQTLDSFSEL